MLENFHFENVNYKKKTSSIQDDHNYNYLNKFEAIESMYISYYDGFMKDLENSINSKKLTGEKNRYFNPLLFSLIKSITFNIPLWSGMMIRSCQEKLKKLSHFNLSSPFFEITRLSNNIVENHIEYVKNKFLN